MGGLFGGDSSSSSSSSSTSTELPSWYEDATEGVYNEVVDIYNAQNSDPYSGSTVASFNPTQQAYATSAYDTYSGGTNAGNAYEGLANTASQGGLSYSPTTSYLSDTASGKYLTPDSNPYLSSYYDAAAEDLSRSYESDIANNDTTAIASGRYGSNAMTEGQSNIADEYYDSLGEMATSIYGGAYDTERGYQEAASTTLTGAADNASQFNVGTTLAGGEMLNQANTNTLSNLSSMGGLGDYLRGIEQEGLDASEESYYDWQNADWNSIANIINALNGFQVGTTTTTDSSS